MKNTGTRVGTCIKPLGHGQLLYVCNKAIFGIFLSTDIVGGNPHSTSLGAMLPGASLDFQVRLLINGGLFGTRDGGRSWVALSPFHNVSDFLFLDDKRGFLVTTFQVYRAEDECATWSPVFKGNPDLVNYRQMASVNGGHVWILGRVGRTEIRFFESTDAGRSWTDWPVQLPEHQQGPVTLGELMGKYHWFPSDFQFVNEQIGWLAAADKVYRTEDGGRSWQLNTDSPGNRVRGLRFVDAEHGWFSAGNSVFRTSSSGRTWVEVVVDSGEWDIEEVEFENSRIGWAVGRVREGARLPGWRVRIFTTNDGGQSWQPRCDLTSGRPVSFFQGKAWLAVSLPTWPDFRPREPEPHFALLHLPFSGGDVELVFGSEFAKGVVWTVR